MNLHASQGLSSKLVSDVAGGSQARKYFPHNSIQDVTTRAASPVVRVVDAHPRALSLLKTKDEAPLDGDSLLKMGAVRPTECIIRNKDLASQP